MADDTPSRHMSLIPYPHQNGEVVLRRGNAVVVYDAHSKQLSVRDVSEQAVDFAECPYCHRPFNNDYQQEQTTADDHERASSRFGPERPFVDPDYFRMLAASQRPSPAGSAGPSTPPRDLRQSALRSGRSRDVSGTQTPPTGAEFVGSEPSTSARQGISTEALSPGYFKQFFKELRVLGKGGNGVVLLVEHIMDRISLGQFACKRVPVGNDHDWLEKVLVEVKLLQQIPHKNLVAYHWVWLEDHRPSKFGPSIPCLWILQEYCNGGDLHTYVLGPNTEDLSASEVLKEKMRRRSKGDLEQPQDLQGPSKLTFDEIFSFFRDVTSGLHHLHSKGYIHRDLKPSNCLLQWDGNRARVLLSDFGEVQAAGAKRGSTGATGTIAYCAPELLQREVGGGALGNFTTKSDIFSLGMIVYFMCFGRLPYSSADDINEEKEDLDELRAEIAKWPGFDDETRVRPDLPEKLYKYLKRLLSVDPNERPSTDDILVSIKAGVSLGEGTNTSVEESSSRVSPVDTPRQRPTTQGRKNSAILGRPGLSTLGRPKSGDGYRQKSPARRKSGSSNSQPHSHSRPTSPTDGSLIMRPRKLDIPPSKEQESPQQSPRLMLPPPPDQRLCSRLIRLTQRPTTIASFRAIMFVAKLLSLMLPCTPYAANAWLLYPLLALAVLDLGLPSFDLWRGVVFFAIHITALLLSYQRGRLCEARVMVWDDL